MVFTIYHIIILYIDIKYNNVQIKKPLFILKHNRKNISYIIYNLTIDIWFQP